MRELEATGEHTTAEINAMVRGGKLHATIPGWVRFADAFARYDSGGASGSGGSRARDREDGDDTGGEDGGDDTNFFRKKSGNAAVQAVYKKNCRLFPSDMSLLMELQHSMQLINHLPHAVHIIVLHKTYELQRLLEQLADQLKLGQEQEELVAL
ncbi:hypothetical protein Tco_0189751, partial [Tanacetum coccineum]